MSWWRPTLLALVLALGAPLSGPGAAPPDTAATTVILVRHAEKDTLWMGADQPLNAAGLLRARELARTLGHVDLDAIYVTPWSRNRQTAEPLARREGDTLTVVDPVDETVRRVKQHRGGTVLVVGHSNTIPQILAALMGRSEPDSMAVRYDDLWVVTLIPGRPSSLVHLRYGAPAGASH
jgi:broad specificity phosphatase PhoE